MSLTPEISTYCIIIIVHYSMLPLPYCNNHVNLLYMYPGNLGGWSQVGSTIIDETGTTATCAVKHNTEYTLLQVHTYKASITAGNILLG